MAYKHPIGDAHPFVAVKELAEAQGYEALQIVNAYEGALIRLYSSNPDIVFRLDGDPGSAMDRQRFDYHRHVRLAAAPPADMLDIMKSEIAAAISQDKTTEDAKVTPSRATSRIRRDK